MFLILTFFKHWSCNLKQTACLIRVSWGFHRDCGTSLLADYFNIRPGCMCTSYGWNMEDNMCFITGGNKILIQTSSAIPELINTKPLTGLWNQISNHTWTQLCARSERRTVYLSTASVHEQQLPFVLCVYPWWNTSLSLVKHIFVL